MGRMYRPIYVGNGNSRLTIGFVDSGADETVISRKLAEELGLETFGTYVAYTATGQRIEGQFAQVRIRDEELEVEMRVGVSDILFSSEYLDEEGIHMILGADFLQKACLRLDFSA
jgi:predicted aspartyl protease